MDLADFARAVFALALTLGLIGLAAVGVRRFGPDAITRLIPNRAERRMAVLESLVLDPSRRLVLVRIDDKEQVLLLGEGKVVQEVEPRPAPPPVAAVETVA